MREPLSGESSAGKPIKVNFLGKTYVWMCRFHNVPLKGGGHSLGMGIECWEGMMFDYKASCWEPDASELFCSGLPEDPTDEQIEECNDSWELVEEV